MPDATTHAVRRWIEAVVIGQGLCPFARPVLERTRIAVSAAVDLEGLIGDLAVELQRLLDTPPALLPTTVLATPRMLADFDDYLDALAVAEAVLADADLEGIVQIASFHPDYRFADAPDDDPAHYTNRSPVPLFHLLRQDDLQHAIDGHPDPDGIPARNQRRLRALGLDAVTCMLAACQPGSDEGSSA